MSDEYIAKVKERCLANGLDPNAIPTFTSVSTDELIAIHRKYHSVLSIIRIFMEKFLSKSKGIPLFVTVTDNKGTFIEYLGDKSLEETIVHQVGLQKGIQFTEAIAGVNSITAALELKKSIQLIGNEH